MTVTPIALLGKYEKDNSFYAAAQILNKDQNVVFDPAFIAGSIVSLYEAFLSHVPESKKIEFEKQFKFYLANMFNYKEQYMIKFDDHNN